MTILDAKSGGLLLPISQSCQSLEVSRSGYYKWRVQPKIVPYMNMDLKNQIQEIALEFPGYGYRRMTAELRYRGYVVNHKRVLDLMRQDNLLCLKKRFKPITTDSSHGLPVYPDHLKNTKITGLNPGLGLGYHIRPVATRAHLSRGDPGSLQQKMHRLGAEQKHRPPTGYECSGQSIRKSMARSYSRTCSSF